MLDVPTTWLIITRSCVAWLIFAPATHCNLATHSTHCIRRSKDESCHTCCSELQWVAVNCSELQWVAACCSVCSVAPANEDSWPSKCSEIFILGARDLIIFDFQHWVPEVRPMCQKTKQKDEEKSKETHDITDLRKGPRKKKSKETLKRDLQKRPILEIYKRNT